VCVSVCVGVCHFSRQPRHFRPRPTSSSENFMIIYVYGVAESSGAVQIVTGSRIMPGSAHALWKYVTVGHVLRRSAKILWLYRFLGSLSQLQLSRLVLFELWPKVELRPFVPIHNDNMSASPFSEVQKWLSADLEANKLSEFWFLHCMGGSTVLSWLRGYCFPWCMPSIQPDLLRWCSGWLSTTLSC